MTDHEAGKKEKKPNRFVDDGEGVTITPPSSKKEKKNKEATELLIRFAYTKI